SGGAVDTRETERSPPPVESLPEEHDREPRAGVEERTLGRDLDDARGDISALFALLLHRDDDGSNDLQVLSVPRAGAGAVKVLEIDRAIVLHDLQQCPAVLGALTSLGEHSEVHGTVVLLNEAALALGRRHCEGDLVREVLD